MLVCAEADEETWVLPMLSPCMFAFFARAFACFKSPQCSRCEKPVGGRYRKIRQHQCSLILFFAPIAQLRAKFYTLVRVSNSPPAARLALSSTRPPLIGSLGFEDVRAARGKPTCGSHNTSNARIPGPHHRRNCSLQHFALVGYRRRLADWAWWAGSRGVTCR